MTPPNPVFFQTPLEILEATRKYFPSAEGYVELDKNHLITFNLRLSQTEPFTILTHAIDSDVFLESIERVKINLEFDKLSGQKRNYKLDSSRFSVQKSLLDWQKFRRVMYEMNGSQCVDVILNYLQNPQEDKNAQIFDLGLAPSQVETDLVEADLEYFRELKNKLLGFSTAQKKTLFIIFQKQYPKICNRILEEQIALDQSKKGDESNDYQRTMTVLKNGVIGQKLATEKMAVTLTSQQRLETNKVFLFVGPTGVGKTELAKAVSKIKKNRFVMFSMIDYQQETDGSKLFGSASGFVGSTDEPHFAKEINPYCSSQIQREGNKKIYTVSNLVLVFDELEKAHSKVKQSLLTLFDEGYCVANYTRERDNIIAKYVFKKCVIISTSNLYQEFILKAFQEKAEHNSISEMFKNLNRVNPQPESFSPELLGRMSIIPFGPIPKGECYQRIIKMKFSDFCSELQKEYSCKAVKIEEEDLFLLALENQLYGNGTDIRKLQKYFDSIKNNIYHHFDTLTPFASKKIIFSCDSEGPYIKFLTFIEAFEIFYEPINSLRIRLP